MKVLKSETEYRSILDDAERLVALDPELHTKEAERLELLTLLIEDYEKRSFSFDAIDPVDAVEFRMSEQGLRQKDLVSLIGSRSRVSEVLARKRPLTVQMIRALSTGLGIPLEALVAEPATYTTTYDDADFQRPLDLSKFPIRAMEKLGWFEAYRAKANAATEDVVRAFLSQVTGGATSQAFYRRTFRGEVIDDKAYYSTLAWTARVLVRAKQAKMPNTKFDPSRITPSLLRELGQLSWYEEGPRLAVEFLAKYGIALVVEPRLPNTRLDGAAMLMDNMMPVIGLTLRFPRVDYFWFTLLHELAHVWKHLNDVNEAFIDRVENIGSKLSLEKEANRIARDALIPRAIWKRSAAFLAPTKQSIFELADQLHIHPAIVVGRLQFETGRYDSFRDILGQSSVHKCFPELAFK